jgi:hypothetical protein
VLNACAHQHVQKVAEKCRREAFTSLVHNGLKAVPSMSDLQAVAFTYRNMVHPLPSYPSHSPDYLIDL